MLSNQTRREVRAPFDIREIINKVEGAQKQYKELLPEHHRIYTLLMDRYSVALSKVFRLTRAGNSTVVAEKYRRVTKAFERIDSYAGNGDESRSYEETLRFLQTTAEGGTKTIDLSQHEFLALDKDDTALQNLRLSISNLKGLLKKTEEYALDHEPEVD